MYASQDCFGEVNGGKTYLQSGLSGGGVRDNMPLASGAYFGTGGYDYVGVKPDGVKKKDLGLPLWWNGFAQLTCFFQIMFCLCIIAIGFLSTELTLRVAGLGSMLHLMNPVVFPCPPTPGVTGPTVVGASGPLIEQEQSAATTSSGPPALVSIFVGPSADNTLCLDSAAHVACYKEYEVNGASFEVSKDQTVGMTVDGPTYTPKSLCIKRTDLVEGWNFDLVLQCMSIASYKETIANAKVYAVPSTGAPQGFEYTGGYTNVVIGDTLASKKSTKCVHDEPNVHCDDSAEQVGRTGKYQDTFHIYYNDDKEICAHRTDADAEWGLNLILKCRNTAPIAPDGMQNVVIGNSLAEKSATKCVADPGGLDCSSHAEVGRTGKFQDTFAITQTNNQICAKRTDHSAPWGLNLVIQCHKISNPTVI
mmetsp:Transcript_6936/g.12256  ORF Transcript_6936/g.12256 Transcript_6936/m.12256 type:complete len:420 (+) Transcript_6936:81-1340(+)